MIERLFDFKMSSNVYEDPHLTKNVRYSEGVWEDGGEREERLVDIYESVNDFPEPHVVHRGEHAPQAAPRSPYKAAAVVLSLLCVLLSVGIIVLTRLYTEIILENEDLNNQLKTRYDALCQPENQTQGNITGWKRFRHSCYYQSTDMKNWEDSRKDCESRGAHLVIINSKDEQEFVSNTYKHGASWLGLRSKKTSQWPVEWNWEWVDKSTPTYLVWYVDVTAKPVNRSMAYIDLHGKWMHTNNGSKQWICEKTIQDLRATW